MEQESERHVIIAQVMMANRKGQYASPSIEPEGCTYLRTYGGSLREAEAGSLDYDDFDLYFDEAAGTYCYRFWSRHVGATSGKETGRSYAEPVAGFATEDEAVQHALSVYRGEQPEHMSPELREWQRRAWWIAAAFMLRHRAKEDPNQIPQIAW